MIVISLTPGRPAAEGGPAVDSFWGLYGTILYYDMLTEIQLPRIARQGTGCLVSTRG